jgi:hypothetical protein
MGVSISMGNDEMTDSFLGIGLAGREGFKVRGRSGVEHLRLILYQRTKRPKRICSLLRLATDLLGLVLYTARGSHVTDIARQRGEGYQFVKSPSPTTIQGLAVQ